MLRALGLVFIPFSPHFLHLLLVTFLAPEAAGVTEGDRLEGTTVGHLSHLAALGVIPEQREQHRVQQFCNTRDRARRTRLHTRRRRRRLTQDPPLPLARARHPARDVRCRSQWRPLFNWEREGRCVSKRARCLCDVTPPQPIAASVYGGLLHIHLCIFTFGTAAAAARGGPSPAPSPHRKPRPVCLRSPAGSGRRSRPAPIYAEPRLERRRECGAEAPGASFLPPGCRRRG